MPSNEQIDVYEITILNPNFINSVLYMQFQNDAASKKGILSNEN